MCTGGRLLADFCAGTSERPDVPASIVPSLRRTDAGQWAVYAHKVARPAGEKFGPMAGGDPYPADAIASCRYAQLAPDLVRGAHSAPDPACKCGFHALSQPSVWLLGPGMVMLEVLLSGRILAFEWAPDTVLFRAARQTVVHVQPFDVAVRLARFQDMLAARRRQNDDPGGDLALLPRLVPRGSGPVALRIPEQRAPIVAVAVAEHEGYCLDRGRRPLDPRRTSRRRRPAPGRVGRVLVTT